MYFRKPSGRKWEKLVDYIATFCVNLAVIGFGIMLFTGKGTETLAVACVALIGGILVLFIGGGRDE